MPAISLHLGCSWLRNEIDSPCCRTAEMCHPEQRSRHCVPCDLIFCTDTALPKLSDSCSEEVITFTPRIRRKTLPKLQVPGHGRHWPLEFCYHTSPPTPGAPAFPPPLGRRRYPPHPSGAAATPPHPSGAAATPPPPVGRRGLTGRAGRRDIPGRVYLYRAIGACAP